LVWLHHVTTPELNATLSFPVADQAAPNVAVYQCQTM
jgi:hypothetical protein